MIEPNAGAAASILVVDDHEIILDLLRAYLTRSPDILVSTANSIEAASKLIAENGPFDVVLLDYHMPGINGLEGLERMLRENAPNPVAILTGTVNQSTVRAIIAAGAAGIVLKTASARTLGNAIRFILGGEQYIPVEIMQEVFSRRAAEPEPLLSERESEVLARLSRGEPNKIIADDMQIALPTVKMHVPAICRKLKVHNRTHAVIVARERGYC